MTSQMALMEKAKTMQDMNMEMVATQTSSMFLGVTSP